jgi:hypothetical protein
MEALDAPKNKIDLGELSSIRVYIVVTLSLEGDHGSADKFNSVKKALECIH